jgi:hypothetical protein
MFVLPIVVPIAHLADFVLGSTAERLAVTAWAPVRRRRLNSLADVLEWLSQVEDLDLLRLCERW